MTLPAIGFVGMTHLGLNSAVAGAERGFAMVCFDEDASLVADLAAGRMPVVEPQLDDLVARNRDRLAFTSNPADLAACAVVYVAPDVATDDAGQSDLATLDRLLRLAQAAAAPTATIVVLSQVPPGYTRQRQQPGRILIYQVETLIFGRAIERAMHPERYIVGLADPGMALPAAYETYLAAHGAPPVLKMRYESAELAKISINMVLVASVTTANTLAELCERIGADWQEIVPALKLDRRIGPHAYLSAGLGISGGNLERDLATVIRFGDQYGSDVGMVRAWLANSGHRKDWPLRMLHEHVLAHAEQPVIAMLGLAYKEATHSTKNSPALRLLSGLTPFSVRVYDPVVAPRPDFHPDLVGCRSAVEAATGADALVLMTPWPEFRDIDPALIARGLRRKVVIDPYSLLDDAACRRAGLRHITLGAAPDGGPAC